MSLKLTMGWKREMEGKALYFMGIPLYRRRPKSSLLELREELEKLKLVNIPAAAAHPEVFSKYKGCYRGKDLALIATGPTLDDYSPMPGAVHLGVNRAYQAKHVPLDLLVAMGYQHIPDEELIQYRPGQCRMLFGCNYTGTRNMSETLLEKCHAERFYFDMSHIGNASKHFSPDLAHTPILVFESVISVICVAFQLALWTHPKRIFLVGCDCSNGGYFKGQKSGARQFIGATGIRLTWEKLKAFAADFYPDIDIISINPVGLKGMFRDAVMKDGELNFL